MTDTVINIIFVTGFIILLLSIYHALRFAYNYRVTTKGIEIVLFRMIPIICIRFDKIEYIRETTFKDILPVRNIKMFFAARLGNKISGPYVVVRVKKGLIKTYVLTPKDAMKFIQEVRAHL